MQEWKNTLLRGAQLEGLAKFWGSFEKQEQKVQELGKALTAELAPGAAHDLVQRFVQAHERMGQGYRQGLAASVGTLGALVWSVRRQLAPLQQAVALAHRVAEGDLTRPADIRGSEEIVLLSSALRRM